MKVVVEFECEEHRVVYWISMKSYGKIDDDSIGQRKALRD